jgi:MT-A70 protein
MSGFLNIFFLLANFEFTKIANIANISQGVGRGDAGMITTPTRPVSTGAIPGVGPGITGGLAFLFPTGSFLFPIERMYPELPKLELFARQQRPGWAAWGNETSKFGEVA